MIDVFQSTLLSPFHGCVVFIVLVPWADAHGYVPLPLRGMT
jgi:hypothetical protein